MANLSGETIGHYRILEQIGHGGMGVVYKAEDLRLKRTVALKFLPAELTSDRIARERFVHEAQAASTLQHENICVIHDIDSAPDGQMYISMELCEGETLRQRISRGPVDPTEATRIATQIARGLSSAHRSGIIHRDLKPANIILTDQGGVKIVDFGLAKLAGQSLLTQEGTTMGTAAYMSPEQARGEQLDRRTDIWSLGVILYEMVAGRLPFRGDHPMAMLYSIANEEPHPFPAEGIPEPLQALCKRCLAKERDLRPQSTGEVLESLGAAPEPTTARTALRLPPLRTLRWAALALPVIVVVIWFLIPARAISLDPADFIVVADFENRTQQPALDHSMTEALRVSLRQSSQFNLLPQERVRSAMELLKIPDTAAVDQQTALAIARREGARAVIAGNCTQLGSVYVLSCGIIDATTGETIRILRHEAPKIEAILGAMDDLCSDVRQNLGESIAQVSKAQLPLDQVTTPSIRALELHSRSNIFESEGRYREAALMNEQAIALDSQFVIAISDLAYEYRKLGEDSLAVRYHRKILPLLHRVTERERLEIMSVYYGPSFELDFPKAFDAIQLLTVRYPNDAYAWATLGHLAMFAGDTKTALAANRKAVELYPDYARTCYNNSGYALALDGRADDAMVYFTKAKELRPDYLAIDVYQALCQWMNDRPDSAEATLLRAVGSADPPRVIQLRIVLASLYRFEGRLTAASDQCVRGISESRSRGRGGDEAYFHLLAGELGLARGHPGTVVSELRAAEKLSAPPYFELVFASMGYARIGRIGDADRALRRLKELNSADPVFMRRRNSMVNLAQAEIDLASGNRGGAKDLFAAVEKIYAGDPLYFIAQRGLAACATAPGDSSAVHILNTILDRRGEIIMGYLSPIRTTGPWTSWLWPDIHLDLARLSLARHDSSGAAFHADAAHRCWTNADPNFRGIDEAQHLLQLNRTNH